MKKLLDHLKEKAKARQTDSDAKQDLHLLRLCQEGNLDAFEELVQRYRPVAMRISMGYLRNTEEAVDCSQDAFVQALESLPRVDPSRPFFPWFYTVLRNVCLKRLRHFRRAKESSLENVHESVHAKEESGAHDHSDSVQQALAELTPEQREVIILRHWENFSYEAMASATGLPVGTIMSRLHYARVQLAKRLAPLENL